MAKRQLEVDLLFKANTDQAKAAIIELNNSLQKIQTMPPRMIDDTSLKNASKAALELQGHLQKAVNVDTGKLDLNKFSQSLSRSGKDLKSYYNTLVSAGTVGQQAFINLARSISMADTGTIKINKRMQEFLTTLKNTARWQISSNIMHGFEGAISSAYRYAQDLNKSLNDIRIVSGQSAEQMAKFAKEANTAAKALSTSTLDYSNAALIYYQQGLADEEIAERTETTIKMANVTRESAETVSDQLTAVWNNFYDGSKTLEYYADVMTALGAATASSTDEISDGLNKFAAVADTVGLSYEYAASALATVTATTRQSADTVGTAFKTLFARIEGLQLGETLEDGVNLNKYSKALDAVGISILDQAGNLKDMDAILDEMGSKWSSISKEQQVALAQTVGGARQYTQLIALMDNWEFFQENLQTSYGSEGTLDKQAEIYAESWEAAQERVGAAAEEIYSQILNDEFFIDLLGGFEEVLHGVSEVIDGLGGMKGVLIAVGGIFMQQYAKEIPDALANIADNFGVIDKKALEASSKLQTQNQELLDQMAHSGRKSQNFAFENQIESISIINKMTQDLSDKQNQLSEADKKAYEAKIQNISIINDELIAKSKVLDLEKQKINLEKAQVSNNFGISSKDLNTFETQIKYKEFLETREAGYNKDIEFWNKEIEQVKKGTLEIDVFKGHLNSIYKDIDLQSFDIETLESFLQHFEVQGFDRSNVIDQLNSDIEDFIQLHPEAASALKDLQAKILDGEISEEEIKIQFAAIKKLAEDTPPIVMKAGEAWGIYASKVMQAATLVNGTKSLFSVWTDEDLSSGERMIQTFTALTMILPAFNGLLSQSARIEMARAGATLLNIDLNNKETATTWLRIAAHKILNAVQAKGIAGMMAMAGVIAVVAIAAIGFIKIIEALTKVINADKIEQERLNKELEDSQKICEQTKNSFEELKTSLENYGSALEAFQSMKDGAEGFNEALEKSNEEARKLIETYGLYNDWEYGERGEIIVDPNKLSEVYSQTEEAVRKSSAANSFAKIRNDNFSEEQILEDYNDGQQLLFKLFNKDQLEALLERDKLDFTEEELNELDIGSKTFDLLKNTLLKIQKNDGDTIEFLNAKSEYDKIQNRSGYQNQVFAEDFINQLEVFGGDEAAQRAYATYLTESSSFKNFMARAKNIEASAEIKALDLEDLAKTYLNEVFGGTEQYSYKIEDGKVSFSSGDNEILSGLTEEELERRLASNEYLETYGQDIRDSKLESEIKAINTLSGDLAERVMNEASNQFQGIDWSLFSPEDVEEIKAKLNSDGTTIISGLFDAFEGYTDDAYWERLEKQQAANIDSQIATEELDADVIDIQTQAIMENTAALAENENGAKQLAINNTRMNEGLSSLIDNWEEWSKVLKDGDKTSEEYAKTVVDLRKTIGDLVGLTDDLESSLSLDFFESAENLALLEDAANADAEAIERLGGAVAKDLVSGLEISEDLLAGFQDAEEFSFFDTYYNGLDELEYHFSATKDILSEMFDQITQAGLKSGESLSAIGDGFNLDNFVSKLNEMAALTGMSVADMQGMLNSIGVEANVTETPIEETVTVPIYETRKTFMGMEQQEDGHSTSIYRESSHIVDYDEFTGQRMVASIKYSKDGSKTSAPKINYVGHGAPSVGNKTKAASKSGGSSSSKKKSSSEEIERYHEIKEVAEDVTRELDRLGKAKDRAWGAAKLKLIDQEISKMEEAIAVQEEYLRQIESNIGPDRNALAAYGAEFDDMGRVSNYTSLMQEQIDKYNAAVASGDEKAIENAEEAYENFEKVFKQYEETSDLWEEEYQNLIDKKNEYYDLLLEKVEYTVELKVEVNDGDLKYLDFLLNRINDDAFKAAESIALLGQKAGTSLSNIDAYNTGILDIFKNHGLTEDDFNAFVAGETDLAIDFTADEINALQEWRDALLDENQNLLDIRETVQETVLDSFRQLTDEIQKGIDKMDHLTNITNSYKNIVDLLGKDRFGISDETLKLLDNTSMDIASAQVGSNKTKLDQMKASYSEIEKNAEAAQKKLEYAKTHADEFTDAEMRSLEEASKFWKDMLVDLGEDIEAAEESYLQSWEAALQTAADVFANSVEMALDNFGKKLSGSLGSLDAMLEVYNQSKTLSEQYLSEYEQIYELSKLTRNINNSIDDTDNIKGKQELRDILREIESIQANGVEMSAYDLEYLQKRYELRLAEIALEESQNAKSSVRMTKDSEGNWSYTYVADDSAVEDAQQNYEDKLFALQDLSSQYIAQIEEQWIQAEIDWSEALARIYQDATLTDEERAARIEATNKFYKERFAFFTDEIDKAIGNNKALYEEDWTAYNRKTGYQISDNEAFADSFNETILGTMYEGIEDIYELQDWVNREIGSPDTQGLLYDLDQSYQTFRDNIEEVMDRAGTSVEGFENTVEERMDEVSDSTHDAAMEVEDAANDMDSTFESIIDNTADWMSQYNSIIEDSIQVTAELVESLNELLRTLSEVDAAERRSNYSAGLPIGGGSFGSGGSGGRGSSGSGGSSSSGNGSSNGGLDFSGWYRAGYFLNGTSYTTGGYTSYGEAKARAERDIIQKLTGMSELSEQEKQKLQRQAESSIYPVAMNTGGYTGAWGDYGKLALLHEKELVLNKEDTANMLSAVDLLRHITQTIDLNAVAASNRLNSLSSVYYNTQGQSFGQEITIYAEFPDATDHTEIEEAFNNLLNSASQYANREKL